MNVTQAIAAYAGLQEELDKTVTAYTSLQDATQKTISGINRMVSAFVALQNGIGNVVKHVLQATTAHVVKTAATSEAAGGKKQLASGAQVPSASASVIADAGQSIADGGKEISDGSKEIAEGAEELVDGAKDIAESSEKIADGAKDLAEGVKEIAEAAKELAESGKEIAEGSKEIAEGAKDATAGAKAITGSGKEIAEGGKQAAGGANDLVESGKKIADAAKEAADGGKQLADGTKNIAEGAKQAADGAKVIAGAANDIAEGSKEAADGAKTIKGSGEDVAEAGKKTAAGAKNIAGSGKEISARSKEIRESGKEIGSGVKGIASGIAGIARHAKSFSTSGQEIASGARDIASGSRGIASAVRETVNGAKEGAEGLKGLIGLLQKGAEAFKDFIVDQVKANAELGGAAENLGMSAQSLEAWSAAATVSGGNAKGLRSSFASLAAGLASPEILGKVSGTVKALKQMGIATTDAKTGKKRSNSDIMLDVADKFKSMPRQDALAMGKNLGFDEGTIELLMQGKAAVQDLVSEMAKHHAFANAAAEDATKLQSSWAKFSDAMSGIGQEIFTLIAPALQTLSDGLVVVSNWANAHPQAIAFIFKSIATAVAVVVGAILGLTVEIWGPILLIGAAATALAVLVGAAINRVFSGIDSSVKKLKEWYTDTMQFFQSVGKVIANWAKEVHDALSIFSGGAAKGGLSAVVKHALGWITGDSDKDADKAPTAKPTSPSDPTLPRFLVGHGNGKGFASTMQISRNLGAQASPRAAGAAGAMTSNTTSETNINGPINITTQATDAKGIAKDIGPQMKRHAFVAQANTGVV